MTVLIKVKISLLYPLFFYVIFIKRFCFFFHFKLFVLFRRIHPSVTYNVRSFKINSVLFRRHALRCCGTGFFLFFLMENQCFVQVRLDCV